MEHAPDLPALPGFLAWQRTFPGTPDQVTAARHLVRLMLGDTPVTADAETIAAELAANAVRHTRSGRPGGTFTLELLHDGTAVRLAVRDQGGDRRPTFTPAPAACADDLPDHGYGLTLVATLATRAGIRGNPLTGHTVWARLALPAVPPPAPASPADDRDDGPTGEFPALAVRM